VTELSARVRQLQSRAPPTLSAKWKTVERALIVPKATPRVPEKIDGVWIVTGKDLFGAFPNLSAQVFPSTIGKHSLNSLPVPSDVFTSIQPRWRLQVA